LHLLLDLRFLAGGVVRLGVAVIQLNIRFSKLQDCLNSISSSKGISHTQHETGKGQL
jgi:hypothetical protein